MEEFLRKNTVDIDKALEFLGDMETYNETIELFYSGIFDRLNKINFYKEKNDMDNYAILVHALKSDCKYLGFTKLSELSLEQELAAKNSDYIKINNTYNKFIEEARKSLSIIKTYIIMLKQLENVDSAIETSNIQEELAGTNNITLTMVDESINKKTLLVVDDSNLISHFIQNTFNKYFDVAVLTDGSEALRCLNNIDLNEVKGIFLDLNMPNVNGFTVLEYMKENNLFEQLPTVIITGELAEKDKSKLSDYPIKGILIKPFKESELQDIVSKMV